MSGLADRACCVAPVGTTVIVAVAVVSENLFRATIVNVVVTGAWRGTQPDGGLFARPLEIVTSVAPSVDQQSSKVVFGATCAGFTVKLDIRAGWYTRTSTVVAIEPNWFVAVSR